MIVIKVNYTTVAPVIKITYDETPIYVKTTYNNVYAKVVYGTGQGGGGTAIWGDINGTLSNQTDLQNALNAKQDDITLTTIGNSGAATFVGNTLNIPQYVGSGGGSVTSVGLSMPSAFTVTNSPVTSSGTLTVTGAGNINQYVRGDGSLTTFPTTFTADKLITEVYNNSGATITKGTVVYINGSQGNLPTIAKANANADSTSAQTFGLVQNDITNMNNGYLVVAGKLSDLDTQAFTDGTQLYLSGTTSGTYTSTKQYAPIHLVYIGVVVRSHPTLGVIEVKIQNGYEVDELHNVSAQTPANNDSLFYESSTSLWKNKSISTVLGYSPEQPLTFSTPLSRATNTISIPVATSSANGYLSSSDWTTFNGKENILSFTSPLSRSTNTISIPVATSSANGYLSSTDWSTFNGKQSAITLTTTGSTGASTFVGNTLNIPTYTLAGLGGISLTSLSATAPLSYNNSTGAFSMPVATSSANGYLSSTDWSIFNGKQSAITLTTTGTSGAATLVGSTLNIPQYSSTGGNGYVLQACVIPTSNFTWVDATVYYFGSGHNMALSTTQGIGELYVPKAGIIKTASVLANFSTAGSAESWSMSILINGTTATTIQAITVSATQRVWTNTALNISVAQGDLVEIRSNAVTWATNPVSNTGNGLNAIIYIE